MSAELVVSIPRAVAELSAKAPALFLPNATAAERFFDFFTSNIRNKNTRRAYYNALCRFSEWCEGRGLPALAHVKPPHVAAYIERLGLPEPDGAGLTASLKNGGTREHAQAMATHSSARTTQLYDWRDEEVSLDEYERVGI